MASVAEEVHRRTQGEQNEGQRAERAVLGERKKGGDRQEPGNVRPMRERQKVPAAVLSAFA